MLKKLKSIAMKLLIRKKEKTFGRIRYLLIPGKRSDKLVIVFSGFAGGSEAHYNYIRTLNKLPCDRLYLLDEYGLKENPGSYYLGENGDFFLTGDILELVGKLHRERGIKKVITVGSSKGGSAAIYYGLLLKADYTVAGAPQYYIGSYLNTDKNRPILEKIMGDASPASLAALDDLMKKEIEASSGAPGKIYLHYSPLEHTYPEHIRDMIRDLKGRGFDVVEDNAYTYREHSDVASYFPAYLRSTVTALLNEKEDT